MKRKFLSLVALAATLVGCASSGETSCSEDYTQYVNLFIGTGGHGHTYPGATVPNGMVQLSPDTRMMGWDACSGYHYSDNTIIGFSHTHLSGTGIGDYGDILLMPQTGTPYTQQGSEDLSEKGYRSAFSHDNEQASPGYYSVVMDNGIKAELTATTRVGMHRYSFPKGEEQSVIVDLGHSLQNHGRENLFIEVLSDTEIRGGRVTKGWAKNQPIFFYAKFNRSFKVEGYAGTPLKAADSNVISGKNAKAILKFDDATSDQIIAAVSISAVDAEGAKKNLDAEVADWDFDGVVADAKSTWNDALSRIKVKSSCADETTIFYTALYHSSLAPNTFIDVDGRYFGQDSKIHQAQKGENYYTVYSLWDTYRAQHPLLSIINPEFNADLAANLVKKYEEGGVLPKWDLWSNYTGTMTGYHAVSVICEAYLKGARTFDAELAFKACLESSAYTPFEAEFLDKGISTGSLMSIGKEYKDTIGYIPADVEYESVANALEYAYSDWAIAQFAKALGKDKEYEEFSKKGKLYQNYFDSESGFMRGKLKDGSWRVPFDPRASNHRQDDYCEGNSWQWSWYVPHDVDGLVALHGSKEAFITKLDSLFTVTSDMTGEQVSADISGLIGQYAHGNEPSHHITHLYNYVGEGWKTQQLVDRIFREFYFNDPNGIAGNEDCGQMSAWYILNAIGLYSIAPASCEYSFARPIFDAVTIPLESGKEISIKCEKQSKENMYIQSIVVNGEKYDSNVISYDTLMSGCEIIFTMGATPQK